MLSTRALFWGTLCLIVAIAIALFLVSKAPRGVEAFDLDRRGVRPGAATRKMAIRMAKDIAEMRKTIEVIDKRSAGVARDVSARVKKIDSRTAQMAASVSVMRKDIKQITAAQTAPR